MSLLTALLPFIAGLGLFLFGMTHLERGLNTLSGATFRQLLRRFTNNPFASILGGTLATMLVQSSSMVGLIMMAMVGAGILPLYNAIGVVLGANLGTTFTGWIVATIGFKVNLTAFSLYFMGLGGLAQLFGEQRQRLRGWGSLIFGLGLLLFGLDTMKTSMEALTTVLDVQVLQGYPAIIYLFAGLLVAAIIQSSSATMMITLSALHSELITLPAAAALVIGADLGTTSTMWLGSLGASAIKKQLAWAQILINVITAVLAFALLTPLLQLIQVSSGVTDPLYQLVAFHSTFNLLGIVCLLPFVKPFARFLGARFQDKPEEVRSVLQHVSPKLPTEAILGVKEESQLLLIKVIALGCRECRIDVHTVTADAQMRVQLEHAFATNASFIKCYAIIKQLEGEILEFCGEAQANVLDPSQSAQLLQLQSGVRHSVYAAKALKDIRENLVMLRHGEKPVLLNQYQAQAHLLQQLFHELLQLLALHPDSAPVATERWHTADQKHRSAHHDIEQNLFRQGLTQGLNETEASTLLNVNREVRAITENLLSALTLLQPDLSAPLTLTAPLNLAEHQDLVAPQDRES